MTYYMLNIDGKMLVYTDPVNAYHDARRFKAGVIICDPY